ncbi:MAG: CocE/NonD family hydrolase [Chloroflexi bacterium]|nr:CocE/NonD family hydrolase [Chloroflexota bacterium]
MRIDWDVAISMDDGLVLRADVFRPLEEGQYAVIMSYGPYAKGLSFQEGYPNQWRKMTSEWPDVEAGSTNKYQNWEVVDPEKWVPHGYAVVRVDSRGTGNSPGYVDVWGPRETRDFYECIEWAGVQPWSSGKVGLDGISYYGMNQWQVAALRPPHLAAICIWEGSNDWYRECYRHGGIYCDFAGKWYARQVESVQYGRGSRAARSPIHGQSVAGPVDLSDEELARNRADLASEIRAHPLEDEFYRSRTPDFSKIEVPLLSTANWGGQGLHPRGNFEGYSRSGSARRWLEVHGDAHWTHFYTDYGRTIQKRFFDHVLKGEDNDWRSQPPVQLQVRHVDRFVQRAESEWPIARTRWTKLYLDAPETSLRWGQSVAQGGAVEYEALGNGVTFSTPPLEHETEITGPVAARLFVSSTTSDADLFLILRVFDPSGREVTFQGALDPHTPIGNGWLRASHRKLDPELTTESRPFHTHDEIQPLAPGAVYELEVEIWPTCIVVPSGYRVALTIRGRDYEYEGEDFIPSPTAYPQKGVGPFTHTNPVDRPANVFGGKVTIHAGGEYGSYLLLPVVPPKS